MTMQYRATVSEGDGLDFVISDGARDRHGTRINPNGWQLAAFKRNPIALFGHSKDFPIGRWENVRVEGGKLMGRLVLAAQGTSTRIDELRSLVEQGILRAVSVGFAILKEGGRGSNYDIESQELWEVSLTSVGSNPNALAAARDLNVSEETLSLAFAEHGEERRRDVPQGENASNPPLSRNTEVKTLAERIKDAQNELNSARDALTEHIKDDNADAEQTEALAGEIEAREARLASLQRAEKALATRAVTEPNNPQLPNPAVRRPLGVQAREPKPEDLIIRAAVCNVLAKLENKDPIKVMEERYRDHEATQIVVRAAVAGATTTQAGWAAELVETAMGAFLESLRPISIYPRLASLGTSLSFGPGRGAIKLPSRGASPSVSGSFVAESAPIPVRKMGLTSTTISPRKMGVISVFSKELAKYSNPQIEGLLRQEIQADTAITLDSALLDNTAGSSVRPAGLLYNVNALAASTAGGYQAILDDIAALAAPFDTANSGRALALIMNPREARRLKMTPGPNASGFGWATQFLEEFTQIVSTTVPAGKIAMVDAADFATAAGDAPEFEVSEQAVLHMEDSNPQQISSAGTPNAVSAPVQSMFQTAQMALRMLMDVSWAMRRPGMVQWIEEVDWATA